MKKRKELNALVSNGKRSIKKTSGSCSAHELLRHDTDTSDLEEFAVIETRKSRKNPFPFSAICLPLCQFVLVTTCILVSATLVWLHIGLREDLDILRTHLQKVKGFNRNTPEQLHTIHTQLKDLDFNVSSLLMDIKRNRIDIENATAEIRQLKDITASLQDSIAAAPAIKSLPKDMDSLSKSVATFGSKLTAMESIVKELKEAQTAVQGTTQNLSTEFENIKVTVQELSNATKAANSSESKVQLKPLVRDLTFQNAIENTKQSVTDLQQELLELTKAVDRMNTTFSAEIFNLNRLPAKMENADSILTGLKNSSLNQDKRLLSVETFSYYNVSSRLEQLEAVCSLDKPPQYCNISEILDLVNKTVTEAVVNIVHSDLLIEDEGKYFGNTSRNLIVDTYNGLTFLAGLLKQFNQMAVREMMTEKNATTIVSHFLNESFHELMKKQEVKLQELENEVNKLSAQITKKLEASTVSPTASTEGPKSLAQDRNNLTASPIPPAA